MGNDILAKEVETFLKKNNCNYALKKFPLIYYKILSNVIDNYRYSNNISFKELREAILEDIDDFNYFKKQIRKLIWFRKTLETGYEGRRYFVWEAISIAYYYVDGNELMFKIRNKLNNMINGKRNNY